MKNRVRFIGLDVHKETIMIAIAESQGGEVAILKELRKVALETAFLLQRVQMAGDSIRRSDSKFSTNLTDCEWNWLSLAEQG